MFDFTVFVFALLAVTFIVGLAWLTRLVAVKLLPGSWWLVPFVILLVFSIDLFAELLNPFPHKMTDGIRKAVARSDVASIVTALKAYQKEYGTMPAGTNAEIVTALRGTNPKWIVFLAVPPRSINERREFVDLWQHPYRIGTGNPEFPWAYSFGQDGKDDGGKAGSDDITSW